MWRIPSDVARVEQAVATTDGPGPGGDAADLLVRQGRITQRELDDARKASDDPIQWLFDEGRVGETILYTHRAMRSGKAFIDLDRVPHAFDAYVISLAQALEIGVLPVKKDGGVLWAAFRDPEDATAIDRLTNLTGLRVIPVVAAPSRLDERLAQFEKHPELWPSEAPSRDPGTMLRLRDSITAEQWAAARAASDDPIRWLLDRDVVGEHEFAMARAWEYRISYPGPSDGSWRNKVPESVSQKTARRLNVLPLALRQGTLLVAVSDPRDGELIQQAEEATGFRVEPALILQARDLADALARED